MPAHGYLLSTLHCKVGMLFHFMDEEREIKQFGVFQVSWWQTQDPGSKVHTSSPSHPGSCKPALEGLPEEATLVGKWEQEGVRSLQFSAAQW